MNYLPKSIQRIASVIGRKEALFLAGQCRHRCLYVPRKSFREDHLIVVILGRQLAKKLQREFGGQLLSVATGRSFQVRERNSEIQRGYGAGKGIRELAQKFRLSIRQVRRVVHSVRAF